MESTLASTKNEQDLILEGFTESMALNDKSVAEAVRTAATIREEFDRFYAENHEFQKAMTENWK